MKNMAGDASNVEVLPGISLSLQGGVDKVMIDGEFQRIKPYIVNTALPI